MTDEIAPQRDILPMMSAKQNNPKQKRIGLLAGAGRFPIVFAKAARRQGFEVITVGPTGMVSEELRDYFTAVFPEHDEDRVKIGDIKKVVKWFAFLKDRDLLKAGEAEEEQKDED